MTTTENTDDFDVVELATQLRATATAAPSTETLTQAILLSDQLGIRSHSMLRSSVAAAREHAVSWQAIGDALGISRQAAFKRFADAEPRDADDAIASLIATTESVFARLSAGDYESVRNQMTFVCSRALTKRKVMGVWADMEAGTGRFLRCSDTQEATPAGRDAVERFLNTHVGALTVVQSRLHHESGEWIGRVAYTRAGKIAGILVTAPDSTDLAF